MDIDMDFPHVDIPLDFIVGMDITGDILNFYKQSCQLKAGIFVLCLEGNMDVSVNLTEYHIKQYDFLTLTPGCIIQFHEQMEKVLLCFIGFSNKFVSSVNLIKSVMTLFPVILDNPVISLREDVAEIFRDYFSVLYRMYTMEVSINPEIMKCILNSVLYGVGGLYEKQSWTNHVLNRGEEISKRLVHFVMEHYAKERSVSFYAKLLNITPQHLSTTIKQTTGKTVSDIIASIVVMDAKAKLKSSDMTIQEIAYSLGFPNVSFFGKYFKRFEGVSPQQYRNS